MDEIVGRTMWPRWARWLSFVLYLAVVGMALAFHTLVSWLNLFSWSGLVLGILRGPVRVKPGGITVPRFAGRTRRIDWNDVESIAAPGRFETVTTLLLADGRDVPLEGIPKEQAPAVAAIGGKPVRNRATRA